jgi:hypothetical protein
LLKKDIVRANKIEGVKAAFPALAFKVHYADKASVRCIYANGSFRCLLFAVSNAFIELRLFITGRRIAHKDKSKPSRKVAIYPHIFNITVKKLWWLVASPEFPQASKLSERFKH